MASESMVEDQSEGSLSNTKSTQLNDQFTSGDDYAPKVRKPYTITKQRERWTEEEHKKFLEALKLYGRAWRRIEEHVGTKTAVQIRSHAQKFFSKVVRESSSGDGAEAKPIEIPPPRPKRKPMHPYPRKLSTPLKSGVHPPRSVSPNSSGSEQENQSPTSVLSAVGSDAFAMGDSCSPNGGDSPNSGSSPASSANGVKPSGSSQSEPDQSPDENGSSTPAQENDSPIPVKVELGWEDKESAKDSSSEAACTQSLKLFGKTVLVTNSNKPSSPNNEGNCIQVLPEESIAGETVKSLPWNLVPMSALPCGAPMYYMQFLNENSEASVVSSSTTPWWSLYGGLSYPILQSKETTYDCAVDEESNKKELRKVGSFTGSSTGFLTLGGNGNSLEIGGIKEGNAQKKKVLLRPSEGSAFVEIRGNNNNKDKCTKGFVPYKRCLAERDNHSPSLTGDEREEQRIRLCL